MDKLGRRFTMDEPAEWEKTLAHQRRVRKWTNILLVVTVIVGCCMFGSALVIIGHFVHKYW